LVLIVFHITTSYFDDSTVPGGKADPLSSIVPGKGGGAFVYNNGLQAVSYDGGPNGNLPPCTTQ